MSGKAFFDTSILIYAVLDDDPRAAVARNLCSDGGGLSVQVLNEFAAVAHRKFRKSWPEIREALAVIGALCEPPASLTLKTHEHAIKLAERYRYNIYDALILASALAMGCNCPLFRGHAGWSKNRFAHHPQSVRGYALSNTRRQQPRAHRPTRTVQ